MTRWRPLSTVALAVVTTLLLLVATLSTWAHFEVISPDSLTRHARRTLQQPSVRDELAQQITQRVAESDPRLAAARPVVLRAAEILISSRQFADIIDIALQQTRRAVLEGDEPSGQRLRDIEEQLRETLLAVDPSIASQVPQNWDTALIDLRSDAPVPTAFRIADRVGRFWYAFCALAFASAVGWIASAYNRRRTVTTLGVVFGTVGTTLVIGRQVVGAAVEDGVHGARAGDAARAAFDVTTHGVHSIGIAYLVIAAVVLAATLTGSIVPSLARGARIRFERVTRLPVKPVARIGWAVGAVAIGAALAIASPDIGPALAVLVGIAVAFAGVRVLVATLPSQAVPARPRIRRRVIALTGVLGVLGLAFVVDRGGDAPTSAAETQDILVCNGHVELCDRRVDEVAFGGTHNSMASADAGFAFAEQIGTIRDQLDRGARVLMLDTHYGIPTSTGLVLTDLVFNDRDALVRRYGEQAVANIEVLRSTVAPTTAPSSVYLCHSFCELGATPASAVFADIGDFLAENPSEVLFVVIQDETRAEDTVRAMTNAGLADRAFAKEPGAAWPTLGELVRNGTPLIVLSQREGGEPSWFMPAFGLVQDNPYTARSIEQLSCAYNRGPVDAPLFLLNHWINKQSPDRADARQINDRSFLLDHVRRCEEERGQRVNLVAVDFMEEGDLVGAIDELNLGVPD